MPPTQITERNTEPTESADLGKLSPDSPEFLQELRWALDLTDRVGQDILLGQLVDRLAPEDFGKAYLAAATLKGPMLFWMALGDRWGRVDPEGGAKFGAEHHAEQNFLARIGGAWGESAPQEAMTWIERVAPQPGHGELTFLILNVAGRVSQNDPRKALDFWKQQKAYVAEWVKKDVEKQLFGVWAKQDPRAAAAAALDVHGKDQPEILAKVAETWAQTDVQAGLAWASQVSNSATRKTFTRDLALSLADIDPKAAITWAQTPGVDFAREQVLEKALAKLASTDVSAALVALAGIPDGKERDGSIAQAIQSIAAKNADGAMQLFQLLPAGPERIRAATAIGQTMNQSDPQAALNWLATNGSITTWQAKNVIGGWLNQSPNDAIAWAQALPAGEKREAALGAVATRLADSDPAKAKAFFQQLSSDRQDDISRDLMRTFYKQDAEQARQWAQSLPPGKSQADALNYVADEWYKKDPAAVAQWINTLPSGQGRDSAVDGYSASLANTDPANAMRCALTIDNALARFDAIEGVTNRWLQSDANAARNWIAASADLSDAQKSHLLKR